MGFLISKGSERSPEEIERLREEALTELKEIVGSRWVIADPAIVDTYAWQFSSELLTDGKKYLARARREDGRPDQTKIHRQENCFR